MYRNAMYIHNNHIRSHGKHGVPWCCNIFRELCHTSRLQAFQLLLQALAIGVQLRLADVCLRQVVLIDQLTPG